MATFRTRARTVDLLGRQQIAGIPTAVHELFKNAHDAYADHVEVDYIRRDRLLVLRDDGLGMTKEEFEERWLVVGTESKVRSAGKGPPRDRDKPTRPVLGEKGIGRLAVGIIGNQVLILSRAVRPGRSCPLVAAYVHWGIFSAPGIDLSEIEVPIREYDDGRVPGRSQIQDLLHSFGDCVRGLARDGRISPKLNKEIQADLAAFRLDPAEQEPYLPGSGSLRLTDGGRGTQFWVYPTVDTLEAELEDSGDKASRIEQQLLGFSNQMTPHAPRPVLHTAFRDHLSPTDIRDVIAPERFFAPGEMLNADHYITGTIDEYGQFRGTVSVFGEKFEDYTVPYPGAGATACGPFDVHLAYVQGEPKYTTLPDEDWYRFNEKAKRLGGVYVYIDGVRVLPYGNVDVDWLEIEERRSKGMTYYFYSHRRMCGAVLLTRRHNGRLAEKAGREGFSRNRAYLDLHAIIVGILHRTAAEFFRKGGVHTDRFAAGRRANARAKAAAARRASNIRERRKRFADALSAAAERVERGDYRADIHDLRSRIEAQVDVLAGMPHSFADLRNAELRAKNELEKLRSSYRVVRGRLALSKAMDRAWRGHENRVAKLEAEYFAPFERSLDALMSTAYAMQAEDTAIPHAQRLLADVGDACKKRDTELMRHASDLVRVSVARRDEVMKTSRASLESAHKAMQALQADLPRIAARLATDADFARERAKALSAVEEATSEYLERAPRLREQFEALSWEPTDDVLEQLAAVEQEAEDLRDRLDDEVEAAQLGMTVEVISHEFAHHIRDIRDLVRALKPWADLNEDLGVLVRDLRLAFEHLDGYLTLFTPLQRRLYRSTSTFTGGELEVYLRRLFRMRLEQEGIDHLVSERFRALTITGYPSTYYPVFVNLVDNAIWWLQDRAEREISLDGDEKSLTVRDTGPGIAEADREFVFERGFSMKPAGRGLGLTIARDSMRRIGGDLILDDTVSGTWFRIVVPEGAIHRGDEEE